MALALPLLDAMRPSSCLAAAGTASTEAPRRMLAICTNMGLMPRYFVPSGEGAAYRPSEYLALLDEHRSDYTAFSGVSHPEVDGGHRAEVSFLTAAPHPSSGGFKNSISLDQYAAERIGIRTRFPYLSLVVGEAENSISFTSGGIKIPAEDRPSMVFRHLFVRGSAAEVAARLQQLRDRRSVLDAVLERAKRLRGALGADDRAKLEQYFTSIRQLEKRLNKTEEWERKPKPKVAVEPPRDDNRRGALIERTRLMFQVARLALETDSTRIIALNIDENANPKVKLPGITQGHHSLTHHGQREGSIAQLKVIETAQMRVFAELLGDLAGVEEGGDRLLDRTMVLFGSNLGNGNSHDNENMPIVLAGGGFRHRQHLAFDQQSNYPLPNLFVSMLQRLGIETDGFASSTGTMRGLEMI